MMERDYIISVQPTRDTAPVDPRPAGYAYEHPTPHDAMQWMADYASRPSAYYLGGGHGESVPLPLPSVSGGSGDPPLPPPPTAVNPEPEYDGGLMVPVEYVLAEGGIANGAAITHHAIQRDPDGARAVGLVAPPVVTTADVVASIRRVRAKNEAIDAVIGRAPVRPTPPAPVQQPAPRPPYLGPTHPSDPPPPPPHLTPFSLPLSAPLRGPARAPY